MVTLERYRQRLGNLNYYHLPKYLFRLLNIEQGSFQPMQPAFVFSAKQFGTTIW